MCSVEIATRTKMTSLWAYVRCSTRVITELKNVSPTRSSYERMRSRIAPWTASHSASSKRGRACALSVRKRR